MGHGRCLTRLCLPGYLIVLMLKGPVSLVLPVKDTIKVVTGGVISASPERKHLWQAQTPQGAHYALLREAFDQAVATGFRGTDDDASLLENIGKKVGMMTGDYRNIKVTTPEDLVIAKALLDSMRKESA